MNLILRNILFNTFLSRKVFEDNSFLFVFQEPRIPDIGVFLTFQFCEIQNQFPRVYTP